MPKPLSDYKVTFRRDPLFGWWRWTATAPDGEELRGLGACIAKANAENAAARQIELHAAKETVDGQALADRVAART